MAVCNLASINLSALVVPPPADAAEGTKATYDFVKLQHISEVVTRNLNRVIDVNYYPIPEARNSNMRHRPIGIGVQVWLGRRWSYGDKSGGDLVLPGCV